MTVVMQKQGRQKTVMVPSTTSIAGIVRRYSGAGWEAREPDTGAAMWESLTLADFWRDVGRGPHRLSLGEEVDS